MSHCGKRSHSSAKPVVINLDAADADLSEWQLKDDDRKILKRVRANYKSITEGREETPISKDCLLHNTNEFQCKACVDATECMSCLTSGNDKTSCAGCKAGNPLLYANLRMTKEEEEEEETDTDEEEEEETKTVYPEIKIGDKCQSCSKVKAAEAPLEDPCQCCEACFHGFCGDCVRHQGDDADDDGVEDCECGCDL